MVQYGNRSRDKLGTMSINEKYCEKHGMRYLYFDSYHIDLTCYWVKVYQMLCLNYHEFMFRHTTRESPFDI